MANGIVGTYGNVGGGHERKLLEFLMNYEERSIGGDVAISYLIVKSLLIQILQIYSHGLFLQIRFYNIIANTHQYSAPY